MRFNIKFVQKFIASHTYNTYQYLIDCLIALIIPSLYVIIHSAQNCKGLLFFRLRIVRTQKLSRARSDIQIALYSKSLLIAFHIELESLNKIQLI